MSNISYLTGLTRFRWLMVVGALLFAVQDVQAQDEAAATVEEAADEADPLAVPEGGPDELVAFIKRVRTMRPQAKTREEFMAKLKTSQMALLTAAEKLISDKKANDEQFIEGVKAKFGALSILGQIGDASARKKVLAFANELSADKREDVVALAREQALQIRAQMIPSLKDDEKAELITELQNYLKEDVSRARFSVAMSAAQMLERSGNNDLAANAYNGFAKIIKGNKDEALASYAGKIEGAARRITLPGKVMELKGETADGSEFDWSSYRGKVVLVDFWATWCGPCIAELPNVKKNYDNYHSKGFEVVGVNLDNSKDKLDKFVEDRDIPWVNLFSSNKEQQGWDNPVATYYGVMAIPTAILVDKDGKVVSLRARGGELTGLLEELLGPVDNAEDKPADDK